MKRLQFLHATVTFLVILAFLNSAASVPASVLAQNSELSKTNSINNNNYLNNKRLIVAENANNKVKRSPNNGLQNPTVLDKKSSPEVVPASYNAPTRAENSESIQEQELQQQYQQQRQKQQQQQQQQQLESSSSLEEAGLSRLTAQLQQQQQQQQQQEQQDLEQQRLAQKYYEDNTNNNNNNDNNYNNNYDENSSSGLLQKRGINAKPYLYTLNAGADGYANFVPDYYNSNPYPGGMDTDLITDDSDVNNGNVMYNDFEDYVPPSKVSSYRNKAYDNLQSLLNSEAYAETQPKASPSVYVPLQYDNGRYYGSASEPIDRERNKRKLQPGFNTYNNNFADMRLKRDSKLTPADMLALVALVEAGERARKDSETDSAQDTYSARNFYNTNPYDYAAPMDELTYNANANNEGWLEPVAMTDYYGVPVNVESVPKYEVRAGHKYNRNRVNNKRFMVAKKNRYSLGKASYNNYAGNKYF